MSVFDRVQVESDSAALAPVQSAFATAVQLLEAGRASLLVRDGMEPVLTVVASVGIEERLLSSIRVPIGMGIAGIVVERNVTLFGIINGETFISAPVTTDDGVEGALNVTQRSGNRQYTVEHIAQATSAASHIGHLIQYGRYAARDPVSGLPNRRAFEEMLERELALGDRTGNSFAVVFLDLDNLKHINDAYGHAMGDEVIRSVGETLQRVMRPYDFAGRLGGDEFALVLSGTSETDGGIAGRIMDAVAKMSEQINVPIGTSVGVARWPEDGKDGDELVALADARMYEHKRTKRQSR